MKKFCSIAILSLAANAKIQLSQKLTCPDDYELLGKTCERTTYIPASEKCLIGELYDGVCYNTTDFILQCPIGTIQNGGQCLVQHSTPALAVCPHGYVAHGNICKKRKPLEIVDECLTGKPDGEGNCIVVEKTTKAKKLSCPDQFYPEGDGCTRISEFDCSPEDPGIIIPKAIETTPVCPIAQAKQVVPKPITLRTHTHHTGHVGGHGTQRYLNSKRKHVGHHHVASYVQAQPVAVQQVTEVQTEMKPIVETVVEEINIQAPPVPPSNVTVIAQKCRRQDFANPIEEYFCPLGYIDEGQYCVKINKTPRMRRCINGASADACYEYETISPTLSCTSGVLKDGVCVNASTLPIEKACPPGTTLQDGICSHISDPIYVCPPGSILDGIMCLKKEVAEPIGVIEKPCIGKECFAM